MAASPAEVDGRVEQIRKEIEASDSDWDKEKLNERLAKLSGGIAVIKVGAATEVEMKERKHRIEDAISATKAAVEEGIVPGGGAALVQVASVLDGGLGLTGDEATGVSIVRKALDEPLRWIAQNAGLDGYVVVSKVREAKLRQGPQRRDRRVRRPGQGRHRRPGQGDPQRGRQRRVDRRAAADHREPRSSRSPRRPEPAAAAATATAGTATSTARASKARSARTVGRPGGAATYRRRSETSPAAAVVVVRVLVRPVWMVALRRLARRRVADVATTTRPSRHTGPPPGRRQRQ